MTIQRKRCIIGGVGASNEIEFVVNLKAKESLCRLASRSKRVWLFKSKNSSKGAICVPLGLYARFLVSFSN